MPNSIKYSTTTPPNSLRKGNVAIGVNDVDMGPTTSTGWYNGVTPILGNYVIYKTAATGDPDVFAPQSDQELYNFVIMQGGNSSNTTSVGAALAWIATQSDLLAVNNSLPSISTNGLVSYLDVGEVGSYPTTGTTMYDLIGDNSYSDTIFGDPSWANNISNLTICALITKTSTGTGYANHPINKWNTSYNVNSSFILYHFENYQGNNQDGQLGWYGCGTNSGWTNVGGYGFTRLSVGQTKWVALQYNSTQGGQAWVNGSKTGGRSGNNGNLGSTTSSTSNLQIYMPGQIGTGYINHILFYNRELTDTEMTQNYNAVSSRVVL
jgi:hypothetical protein